MSKTKKVILNLSSEVVKAVDDLGKDTDADADLVLSRAIGYYQTLSHFKSKDKRVKIYIVDRRGNRLEFHMEEWE